MDSVEHEPYLEALAQYLTGRLSIPSASAVAEAKVLMDFGSSITAISEKLVEVLRGQPGIQKPR